MRQLSLHEAFRISRPPPPPPPPPPPVRRARSPHLLFKPPPSFSLSPRPPPPTRSESENDGVALCYICYEPTTETSQCQCKPTVHADCLLRSIRISKRPHCTICHSPIANLRVRQRRRYYVPLTILMYLAGVFVGIAGVSAMLSVAEAAEEQDLEAFYRLLIRSIGCVMEAIGASKLFTWLLERRDLEMVHAHFDYATDGRGTTATTTTITTTLASVGHRLRAIAPRRGT